MKVRHKMLVGSDIELMPRDIDQGQDDSIWWSKWIGILEKLPPKGERMRLPNGYWAHRDGLSVEYGIPPAQSVDEFMFHIESGKVAAERAVIERLTAVNWFKMKEARRVTSEPSYTEMGCSPDFKVVNMDGTFVEREMPEQVEAEDTRECSGHIHISLPPPFLKHGSLGAQFILSLDEALYPRVVMNLSEYRSWYRHRKVFRFTPYGVEYRSLGAAAMFASDTEALMTEAFDLVRSAWEV